MGSKYKYEGIPLDEYCKLHSLNLETQRNRVRNYIKKYPELSQDEAVKLALDNCGTRYCKYKYKGKSLSLWCKENNENYCKMVSRVESLQEANKTLSLDRIVEIAIEEYNDKGIKYYYDGMPLVDYCKLHSEYNYNTVSTFIRREKKSYPEKDIQEIINSFFEKEHFSHTYHFVDGVPLLEYCAYNDISYSTILTMLCSMRKNEKYNNLTEEERLKLILKNYKRRIFLYYKGQTLSNYCKEHNYSYISVYNYVVVLLRDDESLELETAIEQALKNIKRYGIKYYYDDIPLYQYCSKHELNVKNVRDRILSILSKEDIPLDEAISRSVKYYEQKKHYNNLRKIFCYLKETECIDVDILKRIVDYLNISYDNVVKLNRIFGNFSSTINIIWYFHDNKEGELLSASDDVISKVKKAIVFLSNIENNKIKDVDLKLLVGIYKSGLFDTRYLIILHQEDYARHIISKFSNEYNINITADEINDIISATNVRLLECLDNIDSNIGGQIIKYFTKSIKGFVTNWFLNFINKRKNVVSLNAPVFDKSNSKKELLIEDTLSVQESTDDLFSADMLSAFGDLNDLERLFIIYKYQECLPDSKIVTMLNVSYEQLCTIQDKALSVLKNNDTVKRLHYTLVNRKA